MRNRARWVVLAFFLGCLMILLSGFPGFDFAAQAQSEAPPSEGQNAKDNGLYQPEGASVIPQLSGGPDRFGYTWNDTTAYDWIPATINLGLTGDDKISDPLEIGFDFPFYENTYNRLYVTTNGLIMFGGSSYSFDNRAAPFLVEPQNFIAPFWDDLHVPVGIGNIFYNRTPDYLVILFQNVARYPNTSDLLTFEVILKKSGDICIQYQDLNGTLNEATVAMEDAHGTDGLTYLHNAPGLDILEQSKQLCFIRPGASARAKVLPIYQGGLVVNGAGDFLIDLINTGELGADSYEILLASSDPSWQIALYTLDGRLLRDSDLDGMVESGSVAQGQTLGLKLELYAPETAEPGANTMVSLTAISQRQPSQQWNIQLHGVVPGAFVQGAVVQDAISLLMVWKQNIYMPVVSPNYTGSTISINYLPYDYYLYMWEQNGTKIVDGKNINYTDLEFATLNGFGTTTYGPLKLTSNRAASIYTHKISDRSPVAAVTDTGKIGIAWVRTITNAEAREEQVNVYFAIYDQNNLSVPLAGPFNVTQNTAWKRSDNYDVPVYDSPRITLTSSNHFVLTWSDTRRQEAGYETNIGIASYSVSGQFQYLLENVPGLVSTPNAILYQTPDIYGILGDRLFLSFILEDTFAITKSVGYMVLDALGNVIETPYLIPGIQGTSPSALQFPSGLIMLSWLNPASQGTQQVNFAILDQNNYDIISGPTQLATPNGLSADLLSINLDNLGNAILTWMDMEIEQSIYYALVQDSGVVTTQPVEIFNADGKTITVSKLRAGNAAYIGKSRMNLPAVIK